MGLFYFVPFIRIFIAGNNNLWHHEKILFILSVPACCDTDSIAGVCGDLLQDTVGLDGTVVAGG